MKERLLPVAVLLCCLFALTASAGSIESAVSTNPDKVVDYDSRLLPLGTDTVVDLKEKLQGRASSSGSNGSGAAVTPSESGPPRRVNAGSGSGDPAARTADSGGEDRAERNAESGTEDRAAQRSESEEREASSASSSTERGQGLVAGFDWLQWLLGLLRTVLFALLVLAPAAAAAVVAYDRRDDLLARLDDLTAGVGSGTDPGSSERVARPVPSNAVESAWYGMLDEFDLADDSAKAPEECAQAAIERGAAPAAVRPLTEVFAEVRYGGAPVTERRRERAEEALRQCVQSHSEGAEP